MLAGREAELGAIADLAAALEPGVLLDVLLHLRDLARLVHDLGVRWVQAIELNQRLEFPHGWAIVQHLRAQRRGVLLRLRSPRRSSLSLSAPLKPSVTWSIHEGIGIPT